MMAPHIEIQPTWFKTHMKFNMDMKFNIHVKFNIHKKFKMYHKLSLFNWIGIVVLVQLHVVCRGLKSIQQNVG